MRVFGLFILIFALSNYVPNIDKEKYFLLDSEKFTVKGSSSVGKFDCDYKLKTRDTLFLNENGLSYELPVKGFRCGNFLLNRDFRKTLKHKEYPEVSFRLANAKKTEENEYNYDLYLNIAGKKKTISDLVLTKDNTDLKGKIELKFDDFDLIPPQKLGGAIKVKNDIELSIVLEIKES